MVCGSKLLWGRGLVGEYYGNGKGEMQKTCFSAWYTRYTIDVHYFQAVHQGGVTISLCLINPMTFQRLCWVVCQPLDHGDFRRKCRDHSYLGNFTVGFVEFVSLVA